MPWWVLWLLMLISLGIGTQLAPEELPRPRWVSHLITAGVLVVAGLRFRAEAARTLVAEGGTGETGHARQARRGEGGAGVVAGVYVKGGEALGDRLRSALLSHQWIGGMFPPVRKGRTGHRWPAGAAGPRRRDCEAP